MTTVRLTGATAFPVAQLDGDPAQRVAVHVVVEGAVQGVGFRPFIARLANEHRVHGRVANTLEGVRIEAEGRRADLRAFLDGIRPGAPCAASVAEVRVVEAEARGHSRFDIAPSEPGGLPAAQIVPDLATCPACLAEILDPANRRYRYPFTNCTECGPRYTILRALPYDRANTSMAAFAMCPACRAEYEDVNDRRYHAQPIACPDCGPQLQLRDAAGARRAECGDALLEAVALLRRGHIVAVQGLGGFHLMVDAANADAVARLRARKYRPHKPFAVMLRDIGGIPAGCACAPLEAALLESPQAPIVLLERTSGGEGWLEAVAPQCPTLGVMLPYTPLHHLLLRDFGGPLVATSGNVTDEPICTDPDEALVRLAGIADGFLVHNRPIVRPVDDSVLRVINEQPMLIRRARGYAPLPIAVDGVQPGTLAVGCHQKNTVAVTRPNAVYLSQHIGDLSTAGAVDQFRDTATALPELLNRDLCRVASDTHPDYASTAFARESRLPHAAVQHHYAHALSCMAEHGLRGPVLAVVWDGTGHGLDGTIWGGEFLVADREGYQRVAHFRPFRLPGGDRAIQEPRRSALGVLWELFGRNVPADANREAFSLQEFDTIISLLAGPVNAPLTTSAGRLFDAVASLMIACHRASFEGQAPMALEALAQRASTGRTYRFTLQACDPILIDWEPVVRGVLEDTQAGLPAPDIALGFHEALARAARDVAERIGMKTVVLSGGCMQNRILAERIIAKLEAAGCRVYAHRDVPPNDGGLALGQAYFAGNGERNEEDRPCA